MSKALWLLTISTAAMLFVSIFAAGVLQRLAQVLLLACTFLLAFGKSPRPMGMRVMGMLIFGETVVGIIANLTQNL